MTRPQPLQIVSQNQTIAAIYETVIRAELCDRFSCPPTSGNEDFGGALPAEQMLLFRSSPEFQLHFSRASEILEQQWIRAGRPTPEKFYEDNERFWVLLTSSGQVARASRVAQKQMQDTGDDVLEALGLDADEKSRLKRRLDQFTQMPGGCLTPEIFATSDNSCKLMCRAVVCGQGLQITYRLMIEALDFKWTNAAQDMLSATFGLHQQELQLLGNYFNGSSLAELAETTRGGIDGIKTQLQSILTKSGAPGLEEMVRLFCFLMAEVASDEHIADGAALPAEGQVLLSGDRSMQFYKLGAETGQPIIFLHGLLDGIAGVQRLQMQFRKRGFRVYAPLRCGYGRTGPLASPERSLDTFVNQLEALIEQKNLRRPILLGHRGGASYTHVAARRLRDRVAGAVIVAGMAPVQNLGQLSAMKGHQRMMAVTATYCPSFMPLVAKRWEHFVQQKGLMSLVRQRPGQDCKESALIETPELISLLRGSSQLLFDQKCAGLMTDYYWIVNDWQRHINGSSAPVIYLHGDEDQVTTVERLQQTMIGRRNVQVRLCRGAGSMLLYTRPELVLAALEELADS